MHDRRPAADGGFTRVPVADWDALTEQFRRFDAEVEISDGRIALRSGSARFAVTRDGAVEAGMPLHELSTAGVEALAFDHGRGRIRVESADGDLAYEFRQP